MKASIKISRVNSEDPDFRFLVVALDKELAFLDGEDHSFYAQFNKIDTINHVIVYYLNDVPVACGAIKKFSTDLMEVKRMYVLPAYRGQGIASQILNELEKWAAEMGYQHCILETGLKQQDAIRLYKKNHYEIIENYGQYAGIENSMCFKKAIINS